MESDDDFIEYEIEVVDSLPPDEVLLAREEKPPSPTPPPPPASPLPPPAKEQEKSLVGEFQSVDDTTIKPTANQTAAVADRQSIETSARAGHMAERQATTTGKTIPQSKKAENKRKPAKGQAASVRKSFKKKVSPSEEASPAAADKQQVRAETGVDQSNEQCTDEAINDGAHVQIGCAKASSSASNRDADADRQVPTLETIGPAELTTTSNQATASAITTTTTTTTDNLSAVAGEVNQIPLNEASNSRKDKPGEANNKWHVEPTNDRNDLTDTLKDVNKSSNHEREVPSAPPASIAAGPERPTDEAVIGDEGQTAAAEPKPSELGVTTTDNEQLLAGSSRGDGDDSLASQAAASAGGAGQSAPPTAAGHQEDSSSQAETCEGRQPVERQAKQLDWRLVREPCRVQIEPARQAELVARLESIRATGKLKPIQLPAPVLTAPGPTDVAAREKPEEQVAEPTTTEVARDSSTSEHQQQDEEDDPKRVSISIECADGEAVACALATKFSTTMTGPADGDETGSEDLEWEFDNEPALERRQVEIKRNCDPRKEYELGDELGRGKFGTVYRCVEQSSGRKLAAKFVHMRRREDREDVEREIHIMSLLQHKRLLQLYAAFDDGLTEMCLITELVEGGELFERIIDDDFELTEKKAAIFMRQICEGIEYMHSQEIVHLDMKPENILCLSKTGNRIKLIDFGLARKLVQGEQLRVMFGTPDFAAPEVLGYDVVTPATDMWSIGVICYVLLSGLSPFMGDNDMETMANVTRATYDFEDSAFEPISDLAKDFIAKLLVREPAKRLKPGQCLKHDWLQRGGRQLEAAVRRASIAMLVSSGGLSEQQLASLSAAAAAACSTLVPVSPPTTGVQFASSSNLDSLTCSAMMLLGRSSSPASMFSLDKRNLKKYVVRRKWHKTVHAIMALGRMGANLRTLRSSG